jgi:hypothetical protein
VIILAIVSNIILWNYEMNQVDWEKLKEQTSITNVEQVTNGIQFTFKNNGGLTIHLVSLWIINSTDHQRHEINVFINSAESKNYIQYDITLPTNEFIAKVVTERGNTAVYSEN